MDISALGDDMSEFEKLTDRLESENKQCVKMIEKENQCIASLQSQTEKGKEMIQRMEEDISRMDEETMRLHKQFVQSKDTNKNLKDNENVMMNHDMALTKQLESLKIKAEEERLFYQEQMANYRNIKDKYMKKYESFPLAIERHKKKDILNEKERESKEMAAVIKELQDEERKKEDILDSKVFSRIIIKIAQFKLSTLQTEKEIDNFIVEKASLLEQLKDIQTQQPPVTDNHEMDTNEDDGDAEMVCEERTADDRNRSASALPQTHVNSSDYSIATSRFETADKEPYDKPKGQNDTVPNSPLKPNGRAELPRESKKSSQEVYDKVKIDNHDSTDSERGVTSGQPQVINLPQTNDLPEATDGNQKPLSETIFKGKSLPSRLSGISNQILNLPQVRPIQKPVLKIPSYKPIKHIERMTPKQIPNEVQSSAPPATKPSTISERRTMPNLTRSRISMPTFRMPTLLSNGNRLTDTRVPLKGPGPSFKPQSIKTITRDQKSSTSTPFNLPKLPETSAIPGSISAPSAKAIGQRQVANLKPSLGGKNDKEQLNSFQPNDNEKGTFARTETSSSSSFAHQSQAKVEDPTPQKQKCLERELSSLALTKDNSVSDDHLNVPLFKPSGSVGLIKQAAIPEQIISQPTQFDLRENMHVKPRSTPPVKTPAPVPVRPNIEKPATTPLPSSFNFGSLFKPIQESDSQSPTAFSLINIEAVGGNEARADPENPFLSFGDTAIGNSGVSSSGSRGGGVFSGNVSCDDNEDGRPSSLLNFFSTPGSVNVENLGQSEKGFKFDFGDGGAGDGETDKEASFFKFGVGSDDGDSSCTKGGGFLNFEKEDDDENSGRKEYLFNLF